MLIIRNIDQDRTLKISIPNHCSQAATHNVCRLEVRRVKSGQIALLVMIAVPICPCQVVWSHLWGPVLYLAA